MDSTTLTRTLGLLRKAGLGSREARKGQAGASVPSYAGQASDKWQRLNRTGSGRNSDCGKNLASEGWKSMRADGLANYRSRDGGVNCLYPI